MEERKEQMVALLYKLVLYISIFAMIAGKILHGFEYGLGAKMVNAGIYLITFCPIAGLVTVMFYSYRLGNRRLFTRSLIVTLLILLIMSGIVASGSL
jgi:hypothetical protein